MFVLEVIGGIISNSLALLSDAGHMLTDIFALSLSLFAVKFASMPATEKKTYGFYRIEILTAFINGMVLILLTLYIFYEAYRRLIAPKEVKSLIMLVVASIGLIVNIAGAFILKGSSRENINIRSAFLHIIGDALSSAGVIIGGIIIMATKWYVVDPLLSIAIGVVILRGAYGLVSESVNILLEAVPKGIRVDTVVGEVKRIDGVRDIHDVHIWTLTSGVYALSAHVLISDLLTSESNKVLERINSLLKEKFNIQHTTIQFECEWCSDKDVCVLNSKPR